MTYFVFWSIRKQVGRIFKLRPQILIRLKKQTNDPYTIRIVGLKKFNVLYVKSLL